MKFAVIIALFGLTAATQRHSRNSFIQTKFVNFNEMKDDEAPEIRVIQADARRKFQDGGGARSSGFHSLERMLEALLDFFPMLTYEFSYVSNLLLSGMLLLSKKLLCLVG